MEIMSAIFIALVTGVTVMEVYAWLDALAGWLLRRAVDQIVDEEKSRCEEEWKADLQAMPNSVVKVVYALANFRRSTAASINAEFMAGALDQFDDLVSHTTIGYRRTNYKVQLLRSQVESILDRDDSVLEPKAKDFVGNVTRIARDHQQFGAYLENLLLLRERMAAAAVKVDSPSDARAWVAEFDRGLDEFIFRLRDVEGDNEPKE